MKLQRKPDSILTEEDQQRLDEMETSFRSLLKESEPSFSKTPLPKSKKKGKTIASFSKTKVASKTV